MLHLLLSVTFHLKNHPFFPLGCSVLVLHRSRVFFCIAFCNRNLMRYNYNLLTILFFFSKPMENAQNTMYREENVARRNETAAFDSIYRRNKRPLFLQTRPEMLSLFFGTKCTHTHTQNAISTTMSHSLSVAAVLSILALFYFFFVLFFCNKCNYNRTIVYKLDLTK